MTKLTFTAEEAFELAWTAYLRGRYDADINEVRGTWTEMAEPRATREQRVARRMAEMDTAARARAEREGRPYRIYRGGPVDWETGRPVRELRAAA
ncbi:hypothetical protein ACGF5C_31665 [Micromonospora sp. NPDC047620]|uniref:hypothetical protein n=1 Tax=Micromonospora sp. NPDC047620 TaxID=3364251 RepID=UPI00372375C6